MLDFFKSRFARKKLVYTAIGQSQYFKIADRLVNHGVPYSTKVHVGSRGKDYFREQHMFYDIYVNTEDEKMARESIYDNGGKWTKRQ